MGKTGFATFWTCETATDDHELELKMAAEGMVRARRALVTSLPAEVLHDPSLDMLLALFLAPGNRLSLAELSSSTTVSPQTSKRWLDALQSYDLVARLLPAADEPEYFALSPLGLASIEQATIAVIESQRHLLHHDLH